MPRQFIDASLQVTKALPAANANNTSTGIDLGSVLPSVSLKETEFVVSVPATPALADTKIHSLKVQDSADNATFADVALLATQSRTGAGGAGAAASEYRWSLPPTIRRYVRVYQAVEASGGDNTAVSITVGLKF